jgi:predicted porin
VRAILSLALAFAGSGASGQAVALELKDPIPDNLTWYGVTVYGTIDIGYAYQNHGAKLDSTFPQKLEYNIWGARNASKPVWSLEASALERTGVGIKIEEPLGGRWIGLGMLDTSFSPLSGQLANGPASLLRNYGVPLAGQTANGDSNRAGQLFNGVAYGGISNSSYGTLTFGRQQTLNYDQLLEYGPRMRSYAFGTRGYSAGFSGSGDSEAARWDNSVRYLHRYGAVHAAGQYSGGGPGTGFFGNAYEFNAGGTYGGFSADAVYQRVDSVISASAASSTSLKATISDNQSWAGAVRCTMGLGESAIGGATDDKLTFYLGYEYIAFANPHADPSSFVGSTAQGGYLISAVTPNPYQTNKVLQLTWAGVRYDLGANWSFTAGYYHVDQGAYSTDPNNAKIPSVGIKTAPNTPGSHNDASFVADYQLTKHFDVYAGVNYSILDGGLASGYLNNNMTTVATGIRLKF